MKTPGEMTNGEINRKLDALDKKSSKVTQAFIDAGRGNERPSEIHYQTDALSLRYIKVWNEQDALRAEAVRRYGPGFTGRLPKQSPRRKNPMAGRRRITEAQLKALARGRRTAAANRRKKKTVRKRAPARRRNPATPAGYFSTIQLRAPHDRNGNPRRMFLTFARGNLVGIFDDDYSGVHGIQNKGMRDAYKGHSYDVSASEYNRLNKIRKGGQYEHNPAHGNFLNAIAAKERGGLGREAYQNPVRDPHGKRHHSPTGVPRLLVAGILKGRLQYLGPFGWGPKKTAMSFNTAGEARTAANKTRRKSAVVLPAHTAAAIRAALRKRS